MKEVNEYWQMRIFDLLEGNLSADEAEQVKKEIEKEPALKREFDLMRRTYLEADPVVFADKARLYKRNGGTFSFIFQRKYAAAAAIAIVFGSITIFWYANRKNEIRTEVAQKPQVQMQHNSGNTETQKLQGIGPKNGTSISAQLTAKKQHNTPKKQEKINPEIQFAPTYIGDPEIVVIQDQPGDKDSIAIAAFPIRPTNVVTPEDSFVITEVQNVPVSISKKRSLGYKLLNSSRQMMANLQLPTVKFKTEKNPNKLVPKVKMQITTPNTAIIATLID